MLKTLKCSNIGEREVMGRTSVLPYIQTNANSMVKFFGHLTIKVYTCQHVPCHTSSVRLI
jgi:hypothetical protein